MNQNKRDAWDASFSALVGDGPLQVPGLGVIAYKGGREIYRFAGGFRRLGPDDSGEPFPSGFGFEDVHGLYTHAARRGRESLPRR